MKTTACLLALLGGLATAPALAADRMPAELLGTWCRVNVDEYGGDYKRGQCPIADRLIVRNRSFEAYQLSCQWTRGSINRLGKFLARAKCTNSRNYRYITDIGLIDSSEGLSLQEHRIWNLE